MDIAEIANLIARMARSLDAYDENDLAQCWTSDAKLSLTALDGKVRTRRGTDVTSFLIDGNKFQKGRLRHVIASTTAQIIDEENATCISYTLYIATGSAEVLGLSESTDRLLKINGVWKVVDREVQMLSDLR